MTPSKTLLTLLFVLLAWHCGNASADNTISFAQYQPDSGGKLSTESAMYRVVRSQTEWANLWTPGVRVPNTVDFKRSMALIVSPGRKPDAGYSTLFESVWDMGDSLQVNVLELEIGEGCTAVAMLSHPRAIALIPLSNKPVVFAVTKAVNDCTSTKWVKE